MTVPAKLSWWTPWRVSKRWLASIPLWRRLSFLQCVHSISNGEVTPPRKAAPAVSLPRILVCMVGNKAICGCSQSRAAAEDAVSHWRRNSRLSGCSEADAYSVETTTRMATAAGASAATTRQRRPAACPRSGASGGSCSCAASPPPRARRKRLVCARAHPRTPRRACELE